MRHQEDFNLCQEMAKNGSEINRRTQKSIMLSPMIMFIDAENQPQIRRAKTRYVHRCMDESKNIK